MSSKNAIPAGQFKARCLALLDRVARTGEEVVVTKHGRPVAKVVPIKPANQLSLVGSVKTRGDIVGPILDDWELGILVTKDQRIRDYPAVTTVW